jgi:3'-phosphoadenosine 5'-phosphosulfate sulfotransferase (PAPS reductase)/FAD synthetase
MEISLSTVETPEGPLIIIDIADITERQQAEQTIRRLNAELEERVQQRTAEREQQRQQLTKAIEAAATARSVSALCRWTSSSVFPSAISARSTVLLSAAWQATAARC